ncbi:DUF192 domain-containing protein [Sphingobium sufflavum]|uniref:DUF192 domain-containing protein n=1 Tax=Sphingobium sufflavum TaxID=1129547 RepID=UPI001F29C119|nr:DUF192 domain-containing protein [Sphingobium sufflavum]MCE7796206.1 DUF192 domain-containing protein [Sphingobium sufflavum]
MRALSLPLSALALSLLLCGCRGASGPQEDGANGAAAQSGATARSTVPLRVATTGGTRAFTMEVAVTAAEQEQGLMHRADLPQGHGMLFPFTLPRTASFWMKDTPLPLDLLFIRPDGTVAAVLHGKPQDLHPLSAGEPVSAVAEIGAGEAARLGIAANDRVEWGDCREGRGQPGAPINPLAFCPAAP